MEEPLPFQVFIFSRLRLSALAIALALICLPRSYADAQEGTAMLSGIVRDTLGKPLGDAEVVVVGVALSARTSADGVYGIVGIPAGIRRIVVRRVGYEQVVTDLNIEGGADARMDVDLFPSAPRLPEVVVEARQPIIGPMVAFEERRRSYNGTFITEADVARRKPIRTTDLARGISGVSVTTAPRGVGFVIYMGMGGAQCRPALYLDGLPVNESTLDNLPALDIVGVEVYRKAYDAPPPYLSTSGCGVLAFWSRTGPSRNDR
jgi:hypothetical protein